MFSFLAKPPPSVPRKRAFARRNAVFNGNSTFAVVPMNRNPPLQLQHVHRTADEDDDNVLDEIPPGTIADVKRSKAGRVPNSQDEITALIRNPPRLFMMMHEVAKEQAHNRSREKYLAEALGLNPRHFMEIEQAETYLAFLSCRPSTFSSYVSHIRNLTFANLPVSTDGVTRYMTLKLAGGGEFSNDLHARMLSAVNFFSDCLRANGPTAFSKRVAAGIAYLNPAGNAKIRGSIGRAEIDQILAHKEFAGDENKYLREALLWQAAFGFRSGRMAELRLDNFRVVYVDNQPTFRFTAEKQKSPKTGYASVVPDVQTALPEWYPVLLEHYERKKKKSEEEMPKPVPNPRLFPNWKSATVNAKIQVAARDLGFNPALIWVSHGVRKGTANRAANKVGDEFGWDNIGSIEQAAHSVCSVTGQWTTDIALKYALNNDFRTDLANIQVDTLRGRRPVFNEASPFYQALEKYELEGRVILPDADAALPEEAPEFKIIKSKHTNPKNGERFGKAKEPKVRDTKRYQTTPSRTTKKGMKIQTKKTKKEVKRQVLSRKKKH